MKILITGGSGYLGMHLNSFLEEQGHKVKSLDSKDIDILNEKNVRAVCKGNEIILHLAALAQDGCKENPELALRINGLGTKIVQKVANDLNCKLIYFSTFHVYGSFTGIISENTVPHPQNDYGISKLLGEYYCSNAVILRLSNAYGLPLGTKGWNLVVNQFCKQAVENERIIVKGGEQQRDFVAIPDILQVVKIALTQEKNVFNVGAESVLSIRSVAKMIAEIFEKEFGRKIKLIDESKKPDNTDFVYNIQKLKKLGYKPNADMKEEIEKILRSLK